MSVWTRAKQTVKVLVDDATELWVPCSGCGQRTCHGVLAAVHESENDPDSPVWFAHQYRVIRCSGCKIISFAEDSQFSEDFEHDDQGNMVYPDKTKLYPGRIEGRTLLREYEWLPKGIATIYVEMHEALAARLPVLAGVGLRAVVEAICGDRKAVGDNLYKRIEDLVRQGIVTPDGARILHSIRYLGNKAAHEVKVHSESELDIAREVVEHTLKSVYLIPRKAKDLPKERKPRPKAKKAAKVP